VATTGFEYFRITEIDGELSYVAQPGGREPTRFKRVAGGENWARFENPAHDFPQGIEYRRKGEELHASVSGPGEGAEDKVIRFAYVPCDSLSVDSADVTAIKSIRSESNRAIARHDVEAVVTSLDEDYVITISSGEILYGRAPQDESWAGHFAEFPDVVYLRTPAQVTLSNAYPLAVENGTWEGSMTTPNGKLEKGGSYTAMWRKVDGIWKIRSELFVGLICEGVDC
jgi:ketosteroid isomerase-like protein